MKEDIKTLIFDVNETLLDLAPLKKSINEALNDAQAAELWFAELLHYSLVESITETYHDFSEIAAAIFKMAALKHEKDFSDKEIKKILQPVNELNAYPDAEQGLKDLKDAGFQMIAFSNGKPAILKNQLKFSGLENYFDQVLSVEAAGKYKPHPASYGYALKSAGANASSSMMVAAHAWDVTGAKRAGLTTAFIQRTGKYLFPLAEKPDLICKNIQDLANKLA